jgi:hypothetical protein
MMPMIATTISSSMRVKPFWFFILGHPSFRQITLADGVCCKPRAALRDNARLSLSTACSVERTRRR